MNNDFMETAQALAKSLLKILLIAVLICLIMGLFKVASSLDKRIEHRYEQISE